MEQARKIAARLDRPGGAAGVLLVEDDVDIREALLEVLTGFGWRVVGVGDGHEALAYLKANAPPCLILLDLMMPVMNGYQFRAQQRLDAPLCAIPVVLLSAHVALATDAAALGVAGYIRKPIDVQRLVELVERHCP